MSYLQAEAVKFAYGKDMYVLKGINASFELGKVYAILGPSGCGKTTLLSLLGGLDEPTSGVIKVKGENIQKKGLLNYRKENVAFVFQNFNLIDYLTAEENVNLMTKNPALPLLEKVGLTKEQAKRNILKLSGGQQQRVAIARALSSEADILFADEPTGNLDEETAEGIIDLLKASAHELNKCVVVVTHSQELARNADVVYRLKYGLLEEDEL